MKIKALLSVGLLFIMTACGVSNSDGVISREKNSGGFAGLSTASDIKVDGAKALSGTKDVVVASFKVGFSESSIAKKKAKGTFLSSSSGGNAVGKAKLTGVSDEVKMQITNAAYEDFVAQLQAKGYNVLPRSKYTSSKNYLGSKQYDFPFVDDKSGFLSDYGKTKYYQPASFGDKGVMFMNDIQGESGGFAFGNGGGQAEIFGKSNAVAVISATYFIDFTAAGGHAGISSASVKIGQNLAVTSGVVKFAQDQTSSFTTGTPFVSLGQPIESNAEFGKIKDVTSTLAASTQEVANVFSLMTGNGTNRSKNYEIEADPVKYKLYATNILKDANKALISKASSLRK